MYTDFIEKRLKNVIWEVTFERNMLIADNILKEENKKLLKLLGDVLSMEFLPKKIVLNTKTNTTDYRFLSKRINLKNIDYYPDTIHEQLKQFGVNLPFYIILRYCIQKDKQKKRQNKYLNLDLKR